MRLLPLGTAIVGLVFAVSQVARGKEVGAPIPRAGIGSDRCVVELDLPDGTIVQIDGRDRGAARSVEMPYLAGERGAVLNNYCSLRATFTNGGSRSLSIGILGGCVTKVTLTLPQPQIELLEGPSDSLTSVALSPDGQRVVAGCGVQRVHCWDIRTGRIVWEQTIPDPSNVSEATTRVRFLPDGKQLLVSAEYTGLRLWDSASGVQLRDLSNADGSGAGRLAVSADGRFALSDIGVPWEGITPVLTLWNAKTWRRLHTMPSSACFALAPDGMRAFIGSPGAITVWDTATGQQVKRIDLGKGNTPHALSPDCRTVLTVADETANVSLWDVETSKQLRELSRNPEGDWWSLEYCTFAPSGQQLLTVCSDTATLWDCATGRELRDFGPADREAVAFGLDGTRIVTGTGERIVTLWDATTGKTLRKFAPPLDAVVGINLTGDGQQLRVKHQAGFEVYWELRTGAKIAPPDKPPAFEQGSAFPIDFTPDRRFNVRALDKIVWRDEKHDETHTFESVHWERPKYAAISADGLRVALGYSDRVELWNARLAELLATFVSAHAGADWLVTTPEGYFAGTEAGRWLIRWRLGDDATFPLERFEAKYHRPEAVEALLAGRPVAERGG
jgi:WD40 repeat protein